MSKVTPDDLRKLFFGALWNINRFGWTRGAVGDKSMGFCLIGAVDEYYTQYHPPYGTRNIALRYLEHLIGVPNLAKWNDSEATHEKVKEHLLTGAETADLGLRLYGSYSWR